MTTTDDQLMSVKQVERRRWPRLRIAVPIFVRGTDRDGKKFVELATTLNICAGGALMAIQRELGSQAELELEVPFTPLLAGSVLSETVRRIEVRLKRVTPAEKCYLAGVEFANALPV